MEVFKGIFNLEPEFKVDGSQFDYLIEEGKNLEFGNLSIHPIFVPGHTPACMAYEIGDAIFVGDTLFMPDVGTARCDFPGGSANNLYKSIEKILSYKTNIFIKTTRMCMIKIELQGFINGLFCKYKSMF